jgi:hypothetical protein
MWSGFRDNAEIVDVEGTVNRSPKLGSQSLNQTLVQPPLASQNVLYTPPSRPTTNKSMWLGLRDKAVTGEPGRIVKPSPKFGSGSRNQTLVQPLGLPVSQNVL